MDQPPSDAVDSTAAQWFGRGVAVAVILAASLNAVSYFAWSEHGGNLLGTRPERYEALGLPLVLWEKQNRFGPGRFRAQALLIDALGVVALGCLMGGAMVTQRRWLNRMVAEFTASVARPRQRMHFSLSGLLINILLAGLAAGVLRLTLRGQPLALAAVLVLGPWVLLTVVFLPRGVTWQRRAAWLIPLTVALILAAFFISASMARQLPLERVLFAIFVCWTPQTGLAAFLIGAVNALAWRRHEKRGRVCTSDGGKACWDENTEGAEGAEFGYKET